MTPMRLVLVLAMVACGSDTTSFRTVDRGDGNERGGPAAAAYDVRAAAGSAHVRVWSNGGYVALTAEPMTQVGFEIRNTGKLAVIFDDDALHLELVGPHGRGLPPAAFVAVTPLGPSQVSVAPGATVSLDAYFLLPVRPRLVEAMRVTWSMRIDDQRRTETTTFVRTGEPLEPPAFEGPPVATLP